MRLRNLLFIAVPLVGLLACQRANVEIGRPDDWPSPSPTEPGCLGSDAVRSFMDDLHREMLENWKLPRRFRGAASVRIGFILGADGEIVRQAVFSATDLRIVRSAITALQRAAHVSRLEGPESCLIGATIVGTFATHPKGAEATHTEDVGKAVGFRIDRSPPPQLDNDSLVPLESGTEARPIYRRNPDYPSHEAQRGIEGWVEISFVIKTDGTVGDPIIEDSGGGERFERAALESVRTWRYEPATMNGEPVERCHVKVFLAFTMDEGRGHQSGAKKSFRSAYKEAIRLLDEGQFDEASAVIDGLSRKDDRNLYEDTRLWLLRAMLQGRTNDSANEMKSLQRATISDGKFLEPDVYAGVLSRLLGLQLKEEEYGDALETHKKLLKLVDGAASTTATGSAHEIVKRADTIGAQLEALKIGKQPVAITGEIGEASEEHDGAGVWRHTLLRRATGIEQVDGSLDRVEVRCAWQRVKAEPEPGVAIQLPDSWGSCAIYVFGEPGSTFQLVEYPNPNPEAEQRSKSGVEASGADR